MSPARSASEMVRIDRIVDAIVDVSSCVMIDKIDRERKRERERERELVKIF